MYEQATVLLRKTGKRAISSDADWDYWVVTVPDDGKTHSFRIKDLREICKHIPQTM